MKHLPHVTPNGKTVYQGGNTHTLKWHTKQQAASSVSHDAAGKADYAIPEDNVFIDSHRDNSFDVCQ